MLAVLVIHGPNLNLLGQRETAIYGSESLAQINSRLARQAADSKIDLQCFQSNAEHELIERIHAAAADGTDWILINPAAFTHTSVAIRDALLAVDLPFIEIHLSNLQRREEFRHHSLFSDLAEGVIAGFGGDSYLLALQAVINKTTASE